MPTKQKHNNAIADSVRFTILMSPNLLAMLKNMAQKEDRTTASLVRRLLTEAAEKQTRTTVDAYDPFNG